MLVPGSEETDCPTIIFCQSKNIRYVIDRVILKPICLYKNGDLPALMCGSLDLEHTRPLVFDITTFSTFTLVFFSFFGSFRGICMTCLTWVCEVIGMFAITCRDTTNWSLLAKPNIRCMLYHDWFHVNANLDTAAISLGTI